MPGKQNPEAFYHKQVRAFKRQLLLNAVSECGNDATQIGYALEVDRTTVYSLVRRYAPEVPLIDGRTRNGSICRFSKRLAASNGR